MVGIKKGMYETYKVDSQSRPKGKLLLGIGYYYSSFLGSMVYYLTNNYSVILLNYNEII